LHGIAQAQDRNFIIMADGTIGRRGDLANAPRFNRKARRWLHAGVRPLLGLDRCTLCGKEFTHNSQTFAGVMSGDKFALTGDCCRMKLHTRVTEGIFVAGSRETHSFPKADPTADPPKAVRAKVDIELLQKAVISAVTAEAKMEASRATGIDCSNTEVHTEQSEWKRDDQAWFKAHPKRAYRLRHRHPAEPAGNCVAQVPPHKLIDWIVVQQIRPGLRIRTAFACTGDDTFLEAMKELITIDDEAVAHALHATAEEEGPIRVADIAEKLRRFQTKGVM
jgi:hypothetical protein